MVLLFWCYCKPQHCIVYAEIVLAFYCCEFYLIVNRKIMHPQRRFLVSYLIYVMLAVACGFRRANSLPVGRATLLPVDRYV